MAAERVRGGCGPPAPRSGQDAGVGGRCGPYPAADLEFHVALARAAGNRYLLYVVRDWRALLRTDIELAAAAAIQRFGSLQFSVDAHRTLVDAIDAGEPDVARRILFDLMSRHHEFVLGLRPRPRRHRGQLTTAHPQAQRRRLALRRGHPRG